MKTAKAERQKFLPIKDRETFLSIQKEGKKWVSKSVIVQVRENNLGISRLGFTVTKKVSKLAVTRNRIKRRLRATAADVIGSRGQGGIDYILVGRVETETVPYEQLSHDLKWCLKRLDLLKEK
ncbi:MAG: ribonuclease P protein component [Alphaproteobacteria bacterium]|nr:ribonuclease P protein component [Alphaproteobacteria bacterium]